jgi:hypothetical protein
MSISAVGKEGNMGPHLLRLEEWRDLLLAAAERERRRGEFLLGTIADVLQIGEGCKKGQWLEEGAFCAGWDALRQEGGLLEDGTLLLLGLDQNALREALFDDERGRGDEGIAIWEWITEPGTRPWRTVRRLLLRPTEERWWDQDVFDAMEEMFAEEPDRNG